MANDVVNTDGDTTGNQNLGDRLVKLAGKASNATAVDTTDRYTIPISAVAQKYTDRFDDPRYYSESG